MSILPQVSETAIWERIIQPGKSDLSPEAAAYFLNLSFAGDDLRRMHELAERQQQCELSAAEIAELHAYRQVGLQLDLLRSKARRVVGIRPQRTELH